MTNITIDSVCTKGPIYPMLLHFENGCPKEDFQITCAVLQDRNGNRQIATELNEVVYAGKDEKEDLCKTMILARNRKTGKTRLIEVGHAELKPFTKTDLDLLQQQQHEAGLLNLSRNLTKKHEEIAIQQQFKVDVVVPKHTKDVATAANNSRVDSTVCNEKVTQASSLGLKRNLVNKLEEIIPQKKLKVDVVDREQKNYETAGFNDTVDRVDSSVCNENDLEDFYLPTINRDATKVEDVYFIDQIFTKDDQAKIYWELQGRDCTKDLHPYVQSLVKGKILTLKQTVLALYASELIKYKHLTKAHIRKKGFMMHHHSKTLNNILINRLTKVVKHRNKYKKRGFNFVRVKSKQSKDIVIFDVIISMLMLNDYKLQLRPLCTVLNQSLQFIKNKVCLIGASIVNNDGEELMQLKLPLVQSHASHIKSRNKKAAKVGLDSLHHKSSSLEPSGKIESNKQEKQMESRKYTVTDCEHDITACDENNLDHFCVPPLEDTRTSHQPHENRILETITKEQKKETKQRDELKVDDIKTENVNDNVTDDILDTSGYYGDGLGYYYKSSVEANKVVSDSWHDENGTSDISMAIGSKKDKNRMKQHEKFKVDKVTDIDSINDSFTVDQTDKFYDTNDVDGETSSSETSKFDSKKSKKKIKRRNTLKVDGKTVRKKGQMENVTANVTDVQLDIFYDTNNDSDDLYILPFSRKSESVNIESLQESNKSENTGNCDLRNTERRNDFQTVKQHLENINGHVNFDHIDISAHNNNESQDESSTLDTSWKFESKEKKTDQQEKKQVNCQTVTEKVGGVYGSANDVQLELDISYDKSNDSDDLYILPFNRNRKSTKVDVDSLQQSNESEKNRKGESSKKQRGDDFYVPPINRQATEVEDVYAVEKILSKHQYEKIYLELQDNDYVADLHPYVQSFVKSNLSLRLTVLAVYASELLKFLHAKWRRDCSKTYTICHHSKTLNSIMVKEFTEPDKSREGRVVKGHKDKMVCHVIVFTLMLNDFKVKLEPLCAAVKLTPRFISKRLGLIGAAIAECGDVVQLKLPLVPKSLATYSGKTVIKYKQNDNNYSNEFYVPPLNREATKVDELYVIEEILSSNEYETIYSDLQKYDYTAGLHPYVQSLVKNKILSPKQIVLAAFGSDLIKFLHISCVNIRNKNFTLCHNSKTLNDIILKEFSEFVTFPSGNVFRVKTDPLKHKIMCHVIVFMLILNDFKLELRSLKAAVTQGNRRSFLNIQAISIVGATIVDGDDGEMIQLKLPASKFGFKKR